MKPKLLNIMKKQGGIRLKKARGVVNRLVIRPNGKALKSGKIEN
jgi:hypothetical protein